jgi:hypothetical protein
MTDERERDFFINLLRPVLLKIVGWINRTYGTVTHCGNCKQSVVKFEN